MTGQLSRMARTMRRLISALPLALVAITPVLAQPYDPVVTSNQQEILQNLLNEALVAVRQNDRVSACGYRAQALDILNANIAAFESVFPANNWSDLQVSLQGSVRKCGAAP